MDLNEDQRVILDVLKRNPHKWFTPEDIIPDLSEYLRKKHGKERKLMQLERGKIAELFNPKQKLEMLYTQKLIEKKEEYDKTLYRYSIEDLKQQVRFFIEKHKEFYEWLVEVIKEKQSSE